MARMIDEVFFNSDNATRERLLTVFRFNGPPFLLHGLDLPDARHRGLSAVLLGEFTHDAPQIIPRLQQVAANDPDPNVRRFAASSIERLRAGGTTQPR